MRRLLPCLVLILAPLAASPAAELPADVAERIAWRNGEALFGPLAAALRRP